jgi:hypothetical protein
VSLANSRAGINKLPDGYTAVPFTEEQRSSVLKICVLVRPEPDPAGGHLILLRNTIDAKVFLGCIVDASSRVLDWLELWIQDGGTLISTPTASRLSFTNAILDDRWKRQIRAFEDVDGTAVVRTGFEHTNPLPTVLDISVEAPRHPIDTVSGTPWQLCTDEGLLQQNGLPSYGGSLHRYLYVPALGSDSKFVPVAPTAPTNESTKPLPEIELDGSDIISFNTAAGLMLVKRHDPLDLETYIDILSGAPWDGLKHGRSTLDLGEQIDALRKDGANLCRDGRLFLESRGLWGRLIETMHLKLRMLADIISSVHSMVANLQRPLLNVSSESWRVRLGEMGRGLPLLWTARAVLSDAGDAIPLAIEGTDLQYYIQSPTSGTSIYRPLISSVPTKGRASVRIRSVSSEESGATVIDGTFASTERLDTANRDLVWLRISLASGNIDLYAHIESDSAMAADEWRFRTVGQRLKRSEISELQAAAGVPMSEVPFEVIPLLSSPCDLYSLAVLTTRILFVDNTSNLPLVLDEMLSLMRQIGADHDEATSFEDRIRDVFNRDNRWLEYLGPHHLTFDDTTSDEAFEMVPPELWWQTLRIVSRMFTGVGPDSECRDYGDAQPGGLHKVFERTMEDIDNLIRKTRSLIVSDWDSNREISAVIRKYLTQISVQ